MVLSLFYGISAYLVISYLLYFYTDMTSFDLAHPDLYDKPFVSLPELERLGFPVNDGLRHQEEVRLGRKRIETKTVVLGCLARDIGHNFERMKTILEDLGGLFARYKIVLFENDSRDSSRSLFEAWASENPEVDLLTCCRLGSCPCHLKERKLYDYGWDSVDRIDRMRFYRQIMCGRNTERTIILS